MKLATVEAPAGDLPYDVLAPVYDHFFGPDAAEATARALDQILLGELPGNSRILDLCCGTGELSSRLTRAGYRVTGVDNSGQMLSFAQRRVPSAEFHHADVREFRTDATFDAAICAYNSLPHITSHADLLTMFRNVRNSLRQGGSFVFDLYSERAYADLWRGCFCKVDDDFVCVVQANYDSTNGCGENLITVFRRVKQWERTEAKLTTRCHSADALYSLLQQAGFVSMANHDGEADLGIRGAAGRIFWRAKRGR